MTSRPRPPKQYIERRRCYILFVLVWGLSCLPFQIGAACPKLCHCKWRDGKETVACPNADFIDIPRGLDSTTQVLDLRRNNLKILPNDAFLDTGLVNLQKVWLNYCKLKYIINGAFRHLANLIELDLSDNALTDIPSNPLADVSGLRNLALSRNQIVQVPEESFKSVPLLVKLDLSFNNISSVHENAFAFLNRLEDLKLSFNKLITLPVNVLEPLTVLNGLHVDNNPWHCNCHLRLLRQWLLQRNVAASIPPKCESPERLKGRGWQTLDEDEFVCVPQVTAVAQRVIAAHGDNVTLACRVETDDGAAVTWLVGDKALENTTLDDHRKYSVLELGTTEDGERVSNLTIEGAAVQDQGTYRCVAENKAGRVETNLTLKVSEEITEVRFIAKEETRFPDWFYGAVAGGIGAIASIIIIITFRFRRKNKRLVKNRLVDVELDSKENVDTDSSTESLAQTIQYISTSQSDRDQPQCSSIPVEVLSRSCPTNQIDVCHQQLGHPFRDGIGQAPQHQQISYVEIPNVYLAHDERVFDVSFLEAMIGNQLREMNPNNLFLDPSKAFPDLLNLPSTSNSSTPGVREQRQEPSGATANFSSYCQVPTAATSQSVHPPSSIISPRIVASSVAQSCTSNTGTTSKRHVHFQDEGPIVNQSQESPAAGQVSSPSDSQHLLQYHATQLYKFLQEYKQLQEQLQTFKSEKRELCYPPKSTHSSLNVPTSTGTTSIPDIQSSIEYLLAHQASIPPPIVDTINHIASVRESFEESTPVTSNILAYLPPPPTYSSDYHNSESQSPLHIIPPPSSHSSCSSIPPGIPTTALPGVIPPPCTPPCTTQAAMAGDQTNFHPADTSPNLQPQQNRQY